MGIGDLLANTPYLTANLFGVATVGLAWLCAGSQRRMVLLAGLVALPFFPLSVLFDGEYWTPRRLFSLPFGIEDALYAFVLGARPWFFATIAFRDRYAARGSAGRFLRRALAITGLALAVYAALVACGLGYTLPSLLVPACLLIWLLRHRPELRPLALGGALGTFALGYVELRLWFSLWPTLPGWWTPGTPWSRDFLGIPLGDATWLAVVGATHPAVLAFFCDVRRIRPVGPA